MRRPGELRWGPLVRGPVDLVRPVRLDPTGRSGPTKSQAAGRLWIRTAHGWYVPADAPRHLPEQRILEMSVRLPRHGAVTGWAAGRLLGAALLDGTDRDTGADLPVPLAIGPARSMPASPHVVVTNHVLLPEDRIRRHGMSTVVGARAAYDAARLSPDLRSAVIVIDMLAAGQVCSLAMLTTYAESQPQDARRVLAAAALASEHALSPPETDVRLVVELDLGRPRLLVNPVIHDLEGRRIAMVDLLDADAGLVIEVEGATHRVGDTGDPRRTQLLAALGLEICRVTGSEARRRLLGQDRVRFHLGRSGFVPAPARDWYAVPQPNVLDGLLAQRREHVCHPGA